MTQVFFQHYPLRSTGAFPTVNNMSAGKDVAASWYWCASAITSSKAFPTVYDMSAEKDVAASWYWWVSPGILWKGILVLLILRRKQGSTPMTNL